ncbi:helix-turn-helix domain-containing protein [Nonomuraea phyllanthi]|uniref:helix-turn-helix transcriptional regulator n=1 Tax=Nonomuraea phyllanthi TaxID=2219224 RepID=UPI0012938C13|nr:helix-turn-helix transcriptional regulator [Nonomuraea phyllanthi]QFY07949.1 helix-turn-helix domain-containing protein [Nonomuraea phyllanthi]
MAGKRRRLADRRKALGYSQEFFADRLGIDRTTAGRWELGKTEPCPYIRPKICDLLKVTPGELDDLLVLREESEETTPTISTPVVVGQIVTKGQPAGEGDDMYRRELLRLLSVAGTLMVLSSPANADVQDWAGQSDEADDIEQHVLLSTHLWQVFALSKSKRLVYPLVHDQLKLLVKHMNQVHSARARHQLCIVACDLFQLAGEICFDSNRYTDAAYCYTMAVNAGREARCYDRWACALTRQAFVNLYDHEYPYATAVLSVAARIAKQGDSQLLTRHWVAAVQAEAYAGECDRTACERALGLADDVLDLPGFVSPGGWLRFDGSRMADQRGTCYLTLGRTDLAEASLLAALSQATSLRRRGSLLTDLAAIGLQRRDLDRFLHYAGDAVDLAEQTQSAGYVGRKLHGVQKQLQPLLSDSRVAQLNDRITSLSASA